MNRNVTDATHGTSTRVRAEEKRAEGRGGAGSGRLKAALRKVVLCSAIAASGLGMAAAPAAPASATVSWGDGITAYSIASYTCWNGTAVFHPATNENRWGGHTVYYISWINDPASGGWRSYPQWSIADENGGNLSTQQEFHDLVDPDRTGWIEYGHWDNGTWVTKWDSVTLDGDVDTQGGWCNIPLDLG
jgi:hypothetical protein